MSTPLSPLIHLIDDDDAVRDSLALLISTIGLRVHGWADPTAFMAGFDRSGIGAIVLDVRMPGISGLAVLEALMARWGPAGDFAHGPRHGGHVPPRLQGRRCRVPGKAGE